MLRTLLVCLTIFTANLSAQGLITIKPGISASGVAAVVDSTSIDDFLAASPLSFRYTETSHWDTYRTEDSSVTFSIPKIDLNRIIRRIEYRPEKGVVLDNGFVFGESTAEEIDDFYDHSRAYKYGSRYKLGIDGLTYYFEKNGDKHILYSVLLEAEEDLFLRPNFAYNYGPIQPILDTFILLVSAPKYPDELRQLLNDKRGDKPYRVTSYDRISRLLSPGLMQNQFYLSAGGRRFGVNCIVSTRDSNIVYAHFANADSIFRERIDTTTLHLLFPAKSIPTIIEEVRSLNNQQTFGFWCSVGGSPPAACEKMYTLLKQKDYSTLTTWAKSINPETAAYGYTGLRFLTLDKKKKRQDYSALFEEVEDRNPKLYSCSGCSFTTSFRLQDHSVYRRWKEYLKGITQSGYLR